MPKRTCSVDGCGKPHLAKSYCTGHYTRWHRYGDPGPAELRQALAQCAQRSCSEPTICYGFCRLHVIQHVGWSVRESTGCHLWLGITSQQGYGQLGDVAKTRAHRLSWELANGTPIPKGLVVRHSCDTPACINPDHLSVGTDAQNVWDAISRGRRPVSAAFLAKSECERGHDLTKPDAIYFATTRGKRYARCRKCRHEWYARKTSAARGDVLR